MSACDWRMGWEAGMGVEERGRGFLCVSCAVESRLARMLSALCDVTRCMSGDYLGGAGWKEQDRSRGRGASEGPACTS